MSERKFIAFGTSSQVPGRTRNQGGYLLRWDDQGFLFDPGEGTQRQMIFAGVSVSEITKIFITHFHGDHCLGLAGIIQRLSLDRVPQEIEIYYPGSGQVYFESLKNAAIYFDAARLKQCPVSGSGRIFEDDRFVIQAGELDHIKDTYGYSIREKDTYTLNPSKLDDFGIKGKDIGKLKTQGRLENHGRTVCLDDVGQVLPGQAFAFVMDTRPCKNAAELARGVDMLVCESTYLEEHVKIAQEYGHLTASQAASIARDAAVKRLVLTHFSQRYETTEGFVKEAKAIHPDVVAAHDGAHIPLPRRKRIM